jgi:hypothetical protein
MLTPDLAHGLRIELLDRAQSCLREQGFGRFAQGTPEPTVDRDAEALFRRVGNLRAVGPTRKLPQQPLRLTSCTTPQMAGQRQRKLGDGRLQKRSPHLEAVCHAHAVDFGENIVRQVLADVGPLQFAEVRPERQPVAAGESG